MAIDTQEKRASSCNSDMPFFSTSWFPDGVMTQADRQDATNTYRGVLASAPPPPGRRVFGGWLLWIVLGIALCLVLIL